MQSTHTISIQRETHQGAAVQALVVVLFAGLTALGAQIEIPHTPVPYTMQTFFVLLAGALLGKRNGLLSQSLYLVAGAAGMPVFSQWGVGIAHLVGPTGGYLLAFPIAAFAVGYVLGDRREYVWSLLAMTVGLFIIFTLGTLQLNIVYFHNWSQAFQNGFLIFSWWDGVKLVGAATLHHQVARRIAGRRG